MPNAPTATTTRPCCHWLVTVVGPQLLRDQATGLREVVDGRAALRPARDCLGLDVLEAPFDGWSVLLPSA